MPRKKKVKLANGGFFEYDKHEFRAYDSKGRYLGFCQTQSQAEYMATTGNVNITLTECSELDLWPLWRICCDNDTPLFCKQTGEQIVSLPGGFFLVAKEAEGATGWEVRIISDVEFGDLYFDKEHDCYDVCYADKPFNVR